VSGGWLLAAQALTNLALATPGAGLPPGWRLAPERGVLPATFRVTAAHTLRIATERQSGFASYRVRPLRPVRGALTWQWRTGTPLRSAALRERARDGSPARVFVIFDDGRTIYYTWGNREPVGDTFLSWRGSSRGIVVCRRAEDADGSWQVERRDPFADYRRVFGHAPHPITAVGAGADSDRLGLATLAEVGDLTWEGGAAP